MDKLEKLEKALGKGAKVNEPMGKHTTLKIGGPARLFIIVGSEQDLKKVVREAIKLGLPYLVIGDGSNLLVHDKGYYGLIIRNKVQGIKVVGGLVRVKSGAALQKLIDFSIEKGLSGMECMAGIPGTVGGAIYGSAGAYGQEIRDCLIRVKVFDGERGKWLSNKDCGFGYRSSNFKGNGYVILEAEFRFKKSSPKRLRRKAEEIIKLRLKKYPKAMMCPGSFFKNVLVADLPNTVLAKIPKEKIIFGKIPAGYLLEMVGARGKRRSAIEIVDYHGNLFVNKGNGKATDFYCLATLYSNKVKKKFDIELEPEVQFIGFN